MPGSVLITGASTGIGRALAFEFSRRGFALGLCARRLELLEELEEELSGENQVAVAHLDVAELELALIHISEPTRPLYTSYAVFCLKKTTPFSHPFSRCTSCA